jgi:hypothetical protein
VADAERATLRVGEVFVKIDGDQTRAEMELEAMALAPIPTLRWRHPPAFALAALPGAAPGRLGEPSPASSAAWPPPVAPSGRCTTPRHRRGPAEAMMTSRRGSPTSATGSERRASLPPTSSIGTAGSPRPHCGGYGADVDRDIIYWWWSWRCLVAVRWLAEHGFGPLDEMPEVAALNAQR